MDHTYGAGSPSHPAAPAHRRFSGPEERSPPSRKSKLCKSRD